MKFEKVALKPVWTAPTLRPLGPTDPLLLRALANDGKFAEAVRARKQAAE